MSFLKPPEMSPPSPTRCRNLRGKNPREIVVNGENFPPLTQRYSLHCKISVGSMTSHLWGEYNCFLFFSLHVSEFHKISFGRICPWLRTTSPDPGPDLIWREPAHFCRVGLRAESASTSCRHQQRQGDSDIFLCDGDISCAVAFRSTLWRMFGLIFSVICKHKLCIRAKLWKL